MRLADVEKIFWRKKYCWYLHRRWVKRRMKSGGWIPEPWIRTRREASWKGDRRELHGIQEWIAPGCCLRIVSFIRHGWVTDVSHWSHVSPLLTMLVSIIVTTDNVGAAGDHW